MRSSASLVLLALLAAAPAGGQAPAPGHPPSAEARQAVPPAVAGRVAEWLAREWGVPAARLRLEWGRAQGRAPADGGSAGDPDVPFKVAGRGTDGWLVIVLDPASRAASALRVRAGVEDTVAVAARALASGTRLAAGDVSHEPRLRWGPPLPRVAAGPGPGWEVRRAVAAGEVLERPAVAPPALVAAGAPVRFVWAGGPVQVSVTGIALNSARQGEIVRARVVGRSDRLVGTVTGEGLAVLSTGGIR